MARVNAAGENLVKEFEQFREYAYPDPASPLARASAHLRLPWDMRPAAELFPRLSPDVAKLSGKPWTVGYGETNGTTPASRTTEPEALQHLRGELSKLADQVLSACTIEPNENELAAMTSLAYNVGMGWRGATKPAGAKDGFRQSSVLRAHNRGDTAAASRAFGLWNKAGGQVLAGLTRRRASEAALYLRPARPQQSPVNRAIVASIAAGTGGSSEGADYVPLDTPPMPQEVDPESRMSESPINRASVVAGGTTALALTAETARTVSDVKYSVATLGDWLIPILLLVVIGLCGFLVWQRINQRRGGWA